MREYDETVKQLWECKKSYEQEKCMKGLCKLFSALADLEQWMSRADKTIRFEKTALRYTYRQAIWDQST